MCSQSGFLHRWVVFFVQAGLENSPGSCALLGWAFCLWCHRTIGKAAAWTKEWVWTSLYTLSNVFRWHLITQPCAEIVVLQEIKGHDLWAEGTDVIRKSADWTWDRSRDFIWLLCLLCTRERREIFCCIFPLVFRPVHCIMVLHKVLRMKNNTVFCLFFSYTSMHANNRIGRGCEIWLLLQYFNIFWIFKYSIEVKCSENLFKISKACFPQWVFIYMH